MRGKTETQVSLGRAWFQTHQPRTLFQKAIYDSAKGRSKDPPLCVCTYALQQFAFFLWRKLEVEQKGMLAHDCNLSTHG